VNHDPGIGQAVAFSFRTCGEQDGSHTGGLAYAVGGNFAGDVLHGVVNRETCGHVTPRGVDVDADVFLRVFHLEEKQLGDDGVRHGVIDCRSDENDAILQEAGVDVVGAFAAACLFNDAGNEVVGLGIDAHF